MDLEDRDDMLRDRLIVGLRDHDTKKELLKNANFTLQDTINICKSAELATEQLNNMKSVSDTADVNKITHIQTYGKICENCNGRNHFKKVCKKYRYKNVNEIKEQDSSDDSFVISEIRTNNKSGHTEAKLLFKSVKKWLPIFCILDTGAQVCVMGLKYYEKIKGKTDLTELLPSSHKLRCYSGSEINDFGITIMKCQHKNQVYEIKFHVVDGCHNPLLSESACLKLGLIKYCNLVKRGSSQQEYKIVISEDGEFYLHDGYLTCEDPEDRPRWNHLATVMLIDLWKRQRTRFENNIERNEIIWEEIVSAMREAGFLFTAGQCETRFKYLKKCYIECIDINRKSTGQPERTCSYFEEMDELFHKSPQINPPRLVASRSLIMMRHIFLELNPSEAGYVPSTAATVIARSPAAAGSAPSTAATGSAPSTALSAADIEGSEQHQHAQPGSMRLRPRQSRLEKAVGRWADEIRREAHQREQARSQRHQEIIEIMRESNRLYERIMNRLLDKL
ncbi:hypothetical protein ACJJTC_005250 [Scirpophaga incertulas]